MKSKLFLLILCTMAFVSCEGSKIHRFFNSLDSAIEDYNNGDSSSLIFFIILCSICAILWFRQKTKNK